MKQIGFIKESKQIKYFTLVPTDEETATTKTMENYATE